MAYDITRDGEPSVSANELWSEEIKAWADMMTIESLYYTEDWVFILIDLIAGKISSRPLYVMKNTMNDGVESVDYADNHPLNKLIQEPNPYQDYTSWMYNTVVQYALLGNAVEWYSKSNNWLITLRSSLTSIVFNDDNTIKYYMVSNDEGTSNVTTFKPEEIIHIKRPNPASMYWGLTPLIPGRKSILFNRYSTDYLNSYYLKQATPGMILEMDREVNEAMALRQLRSFELAYTGRKNQRRTMILPKGVKATTSTNSIADQKITDLINMNRETIINLFRAPKHEFSLQAAGSLGSEEYKIALRNFWEATLIPCCKMITGSLNKFFKKQLGEQYFFEFDLTEVEALKDDQMKKAMLAKEMLNAGLSINEVRSRVWDAESMEGYDSPFIAKPQPVSTFSIAPEEEKVIIPHSQKLKDIMERRQAGWVNLTVKELDDEVNKKELEDLAMETLTSMYEAVIPIIKRGLNEVKAAEVPSKTKLKKDIQKAFDEFEEVWADEYTKTLESKVELGYDQQAKLVFNKTDRDKIDVLRAKDKQKRYQILRERGLESFAQISKTQTDTIMRAIAAGVEENDTVQQIAKRISDKVPELTGRAETIARTETLTAVSIGQGAAVVHANKVIPGLKKAWLNSDDGKVRDQHLDKSKGGVSGEVVDADQPFSNGLFWPRDVRSDDASQVINCRCTVIMLPPGEDFEI